MPGLPKLTTDPRLMLLVFLGCYRKENNSQPAPPALQAAAAPDHAAHPSQYFRPPPRRDYAVQLSLPLIIGSRP